MLCDVVRMWVTFISKNLAAPLRGKTVARRTGVYGFASDAQGAKTPCLKFLARKAKNPPLKKSKERIHPISQTQQPKRSPPSARCLFLNPKQHLEELLLDLYSHMRPTGNPESTKARTGGCFLKISPKGS